MRKIFLLFFPVLLAPGLFGQVYQNSFPLAHTFSIVARDSITGEMAVAVQRAAIALANNKQVDKALPILKKVFAADKNWKELTRRLPSAKLLTVSEAELKKILLP